MHSYILIQLYHYFNTTLSLLLSLQHSVIDLSSEKVQTVKVDLDCYFFFFTLIFYFVFLHLVQLSWKNI